MPVAVITSYTTLQEALTSWVDRNDLSDVLPGVVHMTEGRIRRLLVRSRIGPVPFGTISPTVSELTLPVDCEAVRDIRVTSPFSYPIEIVSPAQHADALGRYAGSPGVPVKARVLPPIVAFAPAPDRDYDVEITYYRNLPSLTTLAPVNWLVTEAPDVYLYGTLVNLSSYLIEPDRLAEHEARFLTSIEEIRQRETREEYGAAPLRITTSRRFG